MINLLKQLSIFLIYNTVIALILLTGNILLWQNNPLYDIWGIFFYVPFNVGIYSFGFAIIVGAITKRITRMTVLRSLLMSIITFIIHYFTMWIPRIDQISTYGLFSDDNFRIMFIPTLVFVVVYFITTILVKTSSKYKLPL